MREFDQDTKSVGVARAVNGAARSGRKRRKRRRWSVEQKIRMGRESLASGELVAPSSA